MSLTIIGSGGGGVHTTLQLHHKLTKSHRNITTATRRLVVVAKSGGGGNIKKGNNNNNNNTNNFKAGGKFDSKNKRTTSTTTFKEGDNDSNNELNGTKTVQFQGVERISDEMIIGGVHDEVTAAKLRELPGLKKDFWEGPEWDTFGFFVQYLWAFGILFALVACGVAVGTYNEGATDFKQTPAYKESIQSRDLLEEPENSNSDIFESNPTEEAPSLE